MDKNYLFFVQSNKPLKKLLKKLKRTSKNHSKKKLQSKRRAKHRLKLATLHERIVNHRKDFLHKLSSKMIDENQAIYLEDLNLKGMMGRYGKSISDLGWGMFTRQLEYKGHWYGCLVNKVDRFFPSSKTCNKCGYINNRLSIKNREWICSNCNTHHDRDVNAAINIREYGRVDRNQRTGRAGSVRPLYEPSRY